MSARPRIRGPVQGHRLRGGAGNGGVPPLRRRRRHYRGPRPLAGRPGRGEPDRQAPLGPVGDLGDAAQPGLRRPRGVRQDPDHPRPARAEPGRPAAGTDHAAGGQDGGLAPGGMDRDPRSRDHQRRHVRPCSAAAERQQAVRCPGRQGPLTAAGPGRLPRPADTATTAPRPAPPGGRSTTTGAWAATTTATKAAGSAATSPSAPTISTWWCGITSPACSPTRR
jgi:hypothetical protein